jgi:FKBP-type peptidyl-prolyl cis-trans isomerase FklB
MTQFAPDRACFRLIISLVTALTCAIPVSFAQNGAAAPPAPAAAAHAKAGAATPASDKSATSYSLGVLMGGQLRSSGVRAEDVSSERVNQGFRDAISGKVQLSDTDRENVNKLIRTSFDSLGDTNHKAAAKFLADNGKKPGVVTTASGLQYKVVTDGNGVPPKATDQVVVDYRGTLLDGSEFDSSHKHGGPATFPVNRVIPGWTEGLQLMKPGGKYLLWVPPQLGYDLKVPPGASIPPGSLLVFDVELHSVKATPAPALPAAPALPPTPK